MPILITGIFIGVIGGLWLSLFLPKKQEKKYCPFCETEYQEIETEADWEYNPDEPWVQNPNWWKDI